MIKHRALDLATEFEWLSKRTGLALTADTIAACAEYNGEISAAAAYRDIGGGVATIHFACDKPIALRRGFVQNFLRYGFEVLKLEFMFAPIPEARGKAARIARHIGFTPVGLVPFYGGARQGMLMFCLSCPKDSDKGGI